MKIYNVNIKTMNDTEDIENGYVEIIDGKIFNIGKMEDVGEISADDFDGKGKTLYPGFIDAHCHVGAFDDGLGFEGSDANEISDPITPHLRAIDMILASDKCFREAAENGITTVVTGVGSANAIGGTMTAMKTAGSRRIDKRVIKAEIAMKFALGENPKTVYHDRDEAPSTRMATAAFIREQLTKAKKYYDAVKKHEENDEFDLPEYDIKCEALIPLLKGEMKAHIHCHREDDIFTAIRIMKEFNLDYVLVHATEGGLIADELSEDKVKCIVGPIICDRSKPELARMDINTAGVLHNHNIEIAICTDHPVAPIQYLPLCVGIAIKGGLDENAALKAVTIGAAKILGIDDRVGSIAAGKDADLVIFDGAFTDSTTKPIFVMVDGNRIV